MKFVLLLYLIIPSIVSAQSSKTIILDENTRMQTLGDKMYLLRDAGGNLDVDDVIIKNDDFILIEEDEPNMGFTKDVYWIRFSVRNSSKHVDWILEHTYPPMDYICLYRVENGMVAAEFESGDSIPIDLHPIRGRTFRFPLDSEIGSTVDYYLRFETESSMVLPLKIWDAKEFNERDTSVQFLLGMFFGLLLVMIAYNLFIFISSRELSYLYYVLFVASHALVQACLLGVAMAYLWSGNLWWMNHSLILFAALSVTLATLFTRQFLQTGTWVPRIHVIINICFAFSVINCIASLFLPYRIAIVITNTSLLVYSAVFTVAALAVYRKGYAPARFYLIAWATLLLAVMILSLKNFGVLPSNAFTSNVLQFGTVIEVVLLSLAISDRINLLKQDKVEAEQQMRISQQKELKAVEERLHYDGLTGLPNRNKLLLDISDRRYPNLVLINIDRFKHVNDFYGNKIGNEVILELQRRISSCELLHPTILYKLHADEFALIIESDIAESECRRCGEVLHAGIQEKPYSVGSQSIRLDVSIGISQQAEALLEQADMALTEARKTNTNIRIYDPSMQTKNEYQNNLRWVGVLNEALKQDAIVPYFQPILNNATNGIEKYECLIRLQGENGEIIPPGPFLSIAKASKLYPELSRRMIEKCFTAFSGVDAEFSLNISIDDILQPDTMDLIGMCLNKFDVRGRTVFEILESEGIHRYDLASSFISRMKEESCKIAIDDFGTGYSNFEHILRLKVDYLKLDSSLIKNLGRDPQARTIVETIQQFASKLGIETIAEFVHSEDVQNIVNHLGIHYSQGFLIGEPKPTLL